MPLIGANPATGLLTRADIVLPTRRPPESSRTRAVVVLDCLDLSSANENGCALMPIVLSVRATVPAHVTAAEGAVGKANDYLDLALAVVDPVSARPVSIGGGSVIDDAERIAHRGAQCRRVGHRYVRWHDD